MAATVVIMGGGAAAQNRRRREQAQRCYAPQIDIHTAPPSGQPLFQHVRTVWIRQIINDEDAPLISAIKCVKRFFNPLQRLDRRRKRKQSKVQEVVNASTSRLHRLPVEIIHNVASFMEAADVLALSITCRWTAAVFRKGLQVSIDTRWALRRRLFAEKWKEIADNERIHFPRGQTMLCYRCLSAHLVLEFSIHERTRSAHVRWCLWGPEERTMIKRKRKCA